MLPDGYKVVQIMTDRKYISCFGSPKNLITSISLISKHIFFHSKTMKPHYLRYGICQLLINTLAHNPHF